MVDNRNEQAEQEYQEKLNSRVRLAVGKRSDPSKEDYNIFYYKDDFKLKMHSLVQELISIQPVKPE